MLLTIDALRREIDEYKRVNYDKLSAAMEHREQALSETKIRSTRLINHTRELSERVSTLSTLLRNNEREYLLLRHNSSVHERLMKEDNELLRQQNQKLLNQYNSCCEHTESQIQEHAESLARQTENYVKTFRAHAHNHMQERDHLEEQLSRANAAAKKQQEVLANRVAKMSSKCRRLDKIRRLNAQRQAWEAKNVGPDGSDPGPGKGGTATRSTLLYNRFESGMHQVAKTK